MSGEVNILQIAIRSQVISFGARDTAPEYLIQDGWFVPLLREVAIIGPDSESVAGLFMASVEAGFPAPGVEIIGRRNGSLLYAGSATPGSTFEDGSVEYSLVDVSRSGIAAALLIDALGNALATGRQSIGFDPVALKRLPPECVFIADHGEIWSLDSVRDDQRRALDGKLFEAYLDGRFC